jgi:hypothetical protein
VAVVVAAVLAVGGVGGASGGSVEDYAGFTEMATTVDYVVMVNVLPAEPMFSHAEHERLHPTAGELVIEGVGGRVRRWTRHVEAHVYSRATGEVVTDVVPAIEVLDRTTGRVIPVAPVLMQDVVIGEPDQHFGNNVVVGPDRAITVVVRLNDQVVSVDGRLG